MNRKTFNNLIQTANFRELFITEMGWNKPNGNSYLPQITIGEVNYDICCIAQRNGFQILTCNVQVIPTITECRKIDIKLRRQANDYICIYQIPDTNHHEWVAPVKTNEKRELVLIEYTTLEQSDFLFSKISDLSFGLDEVTTIMDVRERIQGTFAVNSEKITKDFYSGFKKEHTAFAEFITGIDDSIPAKENKDKQWYTSVMLNRLMFCYFIQKKGFLNNDTDYLRNKLNWVQNEKGEDRFYSSFYRGFLVQLFHDGLNAPNHNHEFEQMYGRIPYLNGGMFDNHQLEQQYTNIDISDEAFIRLFDFFDTWQWHLDTRITASGKDINPDVLGYIFEQYINDRAAMGAYYTKEDITEYIGKNCIIPFLMDKVTESSSRDDFKPNGYVWQTVKNSGDRYIYDAVKKGYSIDWATKIPDYISKGIDTATPNLLDRRSRWNEKTFEEFALPTEIWRETVERFQRCDSLLHKINNGEIQQINDFITYNMDIRQFAYDLLLNADTDQQLPTSDHRFIGNFYHALQSVTILDPTCGSGAFLFAAMNILEPLYEVCISRMQEFHAQNANLFKKELDEIANKYRSNIQYFIYKSIILRNLYGVDIMVEATEIAKLRLFLKMVAVVEVDKRAENMGLDPLPDVDFNIRCGNTLVGYTSEDEVLKDSAYTDMFTANDFREKIGLELEKVSMAYDHFRTQQLTDADDRMAFKEAKKELSHRLKLLTDLLDKQLFSVSGRANFEEWKESHQPFHWIAEYYQIIHGNGGFDVIIGNPPYVEYNKKDSKTKLAVSDIYKLNGYKTLECGNLYAFVVERCKSIQNDCPYYGMIIPISMICTQRMQSIQSIISTNSLWLSNYAERPSRLFNGAEIALTIFICNPIGNRCYNTGFTKWKAECRNILFASIRYTSIPIFKRSYVIPKISSNIENSIISKLNKDIQMAAMFSNTKSDYCLYYRIGGGRYWKIFTSFSPKFIQNGKNSVSSRENHIFFSNIETRDYAIAALSSSLFYWFFILTTNSRDLNPSDLRLFPFRFTNQNHYADKLKTISNSLMDEYKIKSIMKEKVSAKTGHIVYQEFYPRLSKPIIDEIDKILAKHYGFTDEELDFIINYDIKYRMGGELNNEEE